MKPKANTDPWISVNDRLPQDAQPVLTMNRYHGVQIDCYCILDLEDNLGFEGALKRSDEVTHWMDIPLLIKDET